MTVCCLFFNSSFEDQISTNTPPFNNVTTIIITTRQQEHHHIISLAPCSSLVIELVETKRTPRRKETRLFSKTVTGTVRMTKSASPLSLLICQTTTQVTPPPTNSSNSAVYKVATSSYLPSRGLQMLGILLGDVVCLLLRLSIL